MVEYFIRDYAKLFVTLHRGC